MKSCVLSLLLVAAPGIAQTAAAPAPAATPTAKEKPVCRRETVIGSIMPTRTCHSKAEWAAIDAANADAAETMRRANSSHSVSTPR